MRKLVKLFVLPFLLLVCGIALNACVPASAQGSDELTHTHKETVDETALVAAVCETAGYKKIVCSECSEVIREEYPPALGHDFKNYTQTLAPTCESNGKKVGTCANDSLHKDEQPITKLGHSFGAWTGTAATCTASGVETRVCANDNSHTERRTSSALGHNYGEWNGTAATCTAEGVETRVCANDDSHTERRTSSALGHDYGNWGNSTATCTETGVETQICARDVSHFKQRTSSALGHVFADAGAVPAAEEHPGISGVTKCERCLIFGSAGSYLPASSDCVLEFTNGIAENCLAEHTESLEEQRWFKLELSEAKVLSLKMQVYAGGETYTGECRLAVYDNFLAVGEDGQFQYMQLITEVPFDESDFIIYLEEGVYWLSVFFERSAYGIEDTVCPHINIEDIGTLATDLSSVGVGGLLSAGVLNKGVNWFKLTLGTTKTLSFNGGSEIGIYSNTFELICDTFCEFKFIAEQTYYIFITASGEGTKLIVRENFNYSAKPFVCSYEQVVSGGGNSFTLKWALNDDGTGMILYQSGGKFEFYYFIYNVDGRLLTLLTTDGTELIRYGLFSEDWSVLAYGEDKNLTDQDLAGGNVMTRLVY